MRNKRGWIRILEATIAVMIVAGVLVVSYTRRVDSDGEGNYFYDLQKGILMDISARSDLRMLVLNENETGLSLFVEDRVPSAFGYYVRICDLGDETDFCKINDAGVVADIQDKSVFAEEIVISANLGDGSNAEYDPKKVKLFVWEK